MKYQKVRRGQQHWKKKNIDNKENSHNKCDSVMKKQSNFPTFASVQKQLRSIQTINSLNEIGVCVLDNFLNKESASVISESTKHLYYNKSPTIFHRAMVSDNDATTRGINTDHILARSDEICWISGNETYCRRYDQVRNAFDKFLYTLMRDYNCSNERKPFYVSHKSNIQVSCFPAGSHGYKPHIDNPAGSCRLLTLVYYPNEFYDRTQHGGCTRFYLKNNKKYLDVEPRSNRLVVHWSDARVVKETLPCHADIFSLTTWYFGEIFSCG